MKTHINLVMNEANYIKYFIKTNKLYLIYIHTNKK